MSDSALSDRFVLEHLPPLAMWPALPLSPVSHPLNCASELVDRRVAAGEGGRVALMSESGHVSYRELSDWSSRIAMVLRDGLGVRPGNRVLLRGFNHPVMVACWLGVQKAGGVAVTSMPLLRAQELRQMLDKARIGFALCDARLTEELVLASKGRVDPLRILPFNTVESESGAFAEETLETRLAALDGEMNAQQGDGFEHEAGIVPTLSEDPALIAFTSGTTGIPKASVHTHRDIMAICESFPAAVLQPKPDDVFCGISPLGFTYGLGGLLCFPLFYGASSLLLERVTPLSLLEAMARHRATICFGVPTLWRQMAMLLKETEVRLPALRCCVSAGEPLPEATRVLWREASGLEIIDGLGSTELLHVFASHAPGKAKHGAIGHAMPGYRLRILDDQGQELPAGIPGRLAVQGVTGCRYLDDARQADYVQAGWNLTGDTGLLDEEGYFYFHARSDDIIVSSGYNIAGPEVEDVLLEHPSVLECGVVGVADPARGQIVKAFVVLHPDYSPDERQAALLQDFVKNRIAPYKYPRIIEFVDRLPRTETSKLQRYRLRSCPDGKERGSI